MEDALQRTTLVALSRDELRAQVRERLLENAGNVMKTARETGVSEGTVRRWRDEFGIPRLVEIPSGVTNPRRLDRSLVRICLLANHGNTKMTARETGVPESTVRRWRNEFGIVSYVQWSDDPWEREEARQRHFWSSVDKESSAGGCWLWRGSTSQDGYGRIFGQRAHRVAFECLHGPLNDRPLHHVCKTKICVNPAHLNAMEDAAAHAELEKREAEFIAYVESEAFAEEAAALGLNVSFESTSE